MTDQPSTELRFQFGKNWRRFARALDPSSIEEMKASILRSLPGLEMDGRRVLDVGCGSGLASAAFVKLGATVEAFDFDKDSVLCSEQLRQELGVSPDTWKVTRGSILDNEFLASLGTFDIVYAWGVLHHTGDLWLASENISRTVSQEGHLVVALYNDQNAISRYWKTVKYLYNAVPVLRPLIVAFHAPYLIGARMIVRALKTKMRLERGMRYWSDMLDWLGGYPFEVASPDEVIKFYAGKSFQLVGKTLCGNRHGCNEFVFLNASDKRPVA